MEPVYEFIVQSEFRIATMKELSYHKFSSKAIARVENVLTLKELFCEQLALYWQKNFAIPSEQLKTTQNGMVA